MNPNYNQGYPNQNPYPYNPAQNMGGMPPRPPMGLPPRPPMGLPHNPNMQFPPQHPMNYQPRPQMGFPPQPPIGMPPNNYRPKIPGPAMGLPHPPRPFVPPPAYYHPPPPPNYTNYFIQNPHAFESHKIQQLKLSPNIIHNGKKLFKNFDLDGSGELNRIEMQNLMNYFLSSEGLPPINQRDMDYLYFKYDTDKNGRFSKREFKWMLKELGGHKKYTCDMISHKRKHKKHKHKYKKHKKFKKFGKFGKFKLKDLF